MEFGIQSFPYVKEQKRPAFRVEKVLVYAAENIPVNVFFFFLGPLNCTLRVIMKRECELRERRDAWGAPHSRARPTPIRSHDIVLDTKLACSINVTRSKAVSQRFSELVVLPFSEHLVEAAIASCRMDRLAPLNS